MEEALTLCNLNYSDVYMHCSNPKTKIYNVLSSHSCSISFSMFQYPIAHGEVETCRVWGYSQQRILSLTWMYSWVLILILV